MPEMEKAGDGIVAGAGAVTLITAKVYSGPNGTGELLADLGTIVGPRTKAEARKTQRKLAELKARRKRIEGKEMKHG